MANATLGTLGVNIAAYAGQFMAELTRAEQSMTKFQRGLSRTLTKAGLDTIGLGNAARAMSNELRYVWDDIEKIKGIDPATISSVHDMKQAVDDFQLSIHQMVAGGMSLFAQFGKSLGAVAGAITTAFKRTSIQDLFINQSMLAANFAVALTDVDTALQADFDAAVKAAQAQNTLANETAKATAAKKVQTAIFDKFSNQVAMLDKQAADMARSELARQEQMLRDGETIRREVLTPQEEWAEQLVRLNELLQAGAINQDTFSRAMRKADIDLNTAAAAASAEKMAALRDQIFGPADETDFGFDRMLTAGDAFKNEMTDMWREISDRGGQAFNELLTSGENVFGGLVDIAAKAVTQMAAQLLLINPILNAVSGLFGVPSSLPSAWSFGGGKATGGPVSAGTAYMVGEKGPELFMPDTAGSIVPNHALGGQGGDSFSFTYHISSGVTKDELMPVLKMQERSLISRIVDAQRRGKQLSPAF